MRLVLITFYCGFLVLFHSDVDVIGGKTRKKNPVNIHVIAIGIDDYSMPFQQLRNCANDASTLVKKIELDKTPVLTQSNTESNTRGPNLNEVSKNNSDYEESKVFTHVLINEKATLKNIKNAFKEVIKNSTTNDYFIFYFAGVSHEIKNNDETILIPHSNYDTTKDFYPVKDYIRFDHLNVRTMASFMNQIPAEKQLIISEAGVGKSFSTNLKGALYESDPDFALNSERNRIILTTIGLGYDSSPCNPDHSPLTSYILENGNILDLFHHYYAYEYKLNKSELACSINNSRYYYLSQEKDYKEILAKHKSENSTRGAIGNKVEIKEEKGISVSKTYALVIGTDTYNKNQQSWSDLRNPLNDANSVANILENKYNVSVLKLYNEPRDKIKSELIKLKKLINKNDKLLVFVAGHGHFSEDTSQGYLVTTDSYSLEDDPLLNSYFSLANLKQMLDNFACQQVFTIMDVCYGASFEMNDADVSIENYSNTKIDNGLDKFILEVDKSYSRLVLASGEQKVFDYWKESQDHSPFASKLIEALANEKEFISPGKIYSYVRGNATQPILKKFGKHEVTGDFLVAVNK